MRRVAHLLAAFLLAGLIAACEESFIDPFDNDERYFTVYGYLDQSNNFQPGTRHAVRVVPITRSPQRILSPNAANAQIDAAVFSIDLETGQELRWTYTLERLTDGSYGHVYQTRFFVQPGASYRLEVRRSDGVVTSAVTRVPATASIVPTVGALTDAGAGDLVQDVLLPGVQSIWDVDVQYLLGDAICFQGSRQVIAYGRSGNTSDAGWQMQLNVSDDIRTLEERLGNTDWRVCSIGISMRVLDDQWTPPGDVFDPEVLAQPAALNNVEKGYGYFGSLGLLQSDWLLSETDSERLGH